jgi:branched-chain amino acid transport system ATP-binding protein
MLIVENMCASYDGIEALRNVNLFVNEGEIVALIGPNGAGKSTLLNCLSGIVRAHLGSVVFNHQKISAMQAFAIARLGLLQVPEGRQILVNLTVEENLQLGRLARGNRQSRYGLNEVYDIFPILKDRRSLFAGSLSGGQQQMLAIGRALMGDPKLLLLDEPSLGLSPLVVDQVFGVLKVLNSEGLTILLVEQNARRALAVTNRSYILESGRIVHEGVSASLATDPRIAEYYLGEEEVMAIE